MDFARALLRYRLELGILSAQQVEEAEASLEENSVTPEEVDRMRQLCIRFLKE